MGYLAVKKILDDNKVNCSKKTIAQASHSTEMLEAFDFKQNDVTIVSLDIEAMCPSIKFDAVQRAVEFFSEGEGCTSPTLMGFRRGQDECPS